MQCCPSGSGYDGGCCPAVSTTEKSDSTSESQESGGDDSDTVTEPAPAPLSNQGEIPNGEVKRWDPSAFR